MTTCKDSIELLRAYVDGELTADQRMALDEHFGDCTPCEEFLATYRATPRVCREVMKREMPDEVVRRLKAYLRGAVCECGQRDADGTEPPKS